MPNPLVNAFFLGAGEAGEIDRLGVEPDPLVNAFFLGALAMGCWVAGLFFMRFWRKTRDRLFLTFAGAFWLLGVTRVMTAMTEHSDERARYIYVVRLLAYILILMAIIDKNRSARRAPPG